MNRIAEEILMHYGTKMHSGRYPWGSGNEPYQHSGDFLSRVESLQKEGLNEKDIASKIGLSTTELRMQTRLAKHERRRLQADRARSLREDGKSLAEIANIMGYTNDSSIRSLLNEDTSLRKDRAKLTAEILKKEIEAKGMVDSGKGVEIELGVSRETLAEAVFILRTEGYNAYGVGIPTGPGQQSNTLILCKPEVKYGEVYKNMGDIQPVGEYTSTDGGDSFRERKYPASVDSKRVAIRYGDQGGNEKDGVIEIRRGVEDLDLGNSHYAQVRILVDGTHYLKGMAMYSDDMPDGADIVFNTNKKSDKSKMEVLKPIENDPKNPFKAYIKSKGQSEYTDAEGNVKLSAINKLKEEGDWDVMSKNLSSQFLSKQPMDLIKKQLNLTYADYLAEYDEISSYTNPTIKKKLLLEFANKCEGAVVHLKAAALPRQKTQVILPLTELKDNEVYAPNFKDGETIALIRYPHGGTFEIPVLTVNNKNPSGKKILGNVTDAIGINPKVAERLSGADFDGDTVVAIPTNNKVRIASAPPLKGLENFNPKDEYAQRPGMKLMTDTQREMGIVSNLITDMTLIGANENEIVRAIKHSMVVIDAEKHKLDYKRSEKENGIKELKQKYQQKYDDDGYIIDGKAGGASTLISKKKQNVLVPERKGSGIIDPDTGKVSYRESGRTYVKKGKIVTATDKIKLLNYVDDAYKLSSGTPKENAYADYINKMKSLINQARKEFKSTGNIQVSDTAKKIYKDEVNDLNNQLNKALANAPKERLAQAVANSVVKAKKQDNPDLEKNKKELGKIREQALYDSRAKFGASGKNTKINISDRQWEAIQAGAISDTKLFSILKYADMDQLRQRAMPKTYNSLSPTKQNKIQAMLSSGYTNSQIAESLGVSTSTITNFIKTEKGGEAS